MPDTPFFVATFGPTTGPPEGGIEFVATGTDLHTVTACYFGVLTPANRVTDLRVSQSKITGTVPDWAGTTNPTAVNFHYRDAAGVTRAAYVAGFMYVIGWTGPGRPPDVCRRRAWLVMGSRTLPLEDTVAGYACTNLDLGGMGEVRAVTNNRPTQDGVDDRTLYMGARAISAEIRAAGGGLMTVDEIGAVFGPYMLPNARPELHYILDRPGAPERFTTVRAAEYTWPISGARTRSIHLGWVAADPIMYGAALNTVSALAGPSISGGRLYDLAFNRIYPPGGGGPSTGEIRSPGDVVVRPLLRIWGPITNPVVTLTPTTGSEPAGPPAKVAFTPGFVINAGDWVDVDTAAKTAFRNSDPARSVMAQLDWAATVWPVLPTDPYWTWLTVAGGTTSSTSQVQALWYDGYLS